MSKEGFWMIEYTGRVGTGVGLLAFDTCVIAGVEVLGGTLDGTYVHDPRSNTLQSEIVWRAGNIPGFLAQSGEFITPGMTFKVNVDLPNELDTPVPVRIDTPKGPLDVVFRKIRNFPT